MKCIFEKDYKAFKGLESRYQKAVTKEERQAVREEYEQWQYRMDMIETDEYRRLFLLYADAKDRGNSYIDFSEPLQHSDLKKLVGAMRMCGIKCFTFSCNWSGANDTIRGFLQTGCAMMGTREINGPRKLFCSDEYEKKIAYVFKVV